MADVFDGPADGRQSTNPALKPSRFRPRYRQLTDDEKALHDEIKAKAADLEELFERVPEGRYRSLGLTSLEESVMWTVKQLTA